MHVLHLCKYSGIKLYAAVTWMAVKNPLRRASSRKLRFRSALAAVAALCARNSMTAKGDAWQ